MVRHPYITNLISFKYRIYIGIIVYNSNYSFDVLYILYNYTLKCKCNIYYIPIIINTYKRLMCALPKKSIRLSFVVSHARFMFLEVCIRFYLFSFYFLFSFSFCFYYIFTYITFILYRWYEWLNSSFCYKYFLEYIKRHIYILDCQDFWRLLKN